MIEKATKKLDLEQLKCFEYSRKQRGMVEEARQDLGSYAAASAGSQGQILGSSAKLNMIQEKLPALMDSLHALEEKCSKDVDVLDKQIMAASQDVNVMDKVKTASSCGSALLLQCHRGRGRRTASGDAPAISFITLGNRHHHLRRAMAKVRSRIGRREMQRGLREVVRQHDHHHVRGRNHYRRGHAYTRRAGRSLRALQSSA
jgi:hypothetical protein